MTTSKQTYIREMEEELKKWDSRLAELKEKLQGAAKNKLELQSVIDDMSMKKTLMEQKLKDLMKSETGWQELKKSIEGTVSNLDDNYRSAFAYTVN